MSYGLMVYQMRILDLESLYGCQDEAMVSEVQNQCSWMIESYDESFEDAIALGSPSLLHAFRQIIKGEPLDRKYGAAYAYAVKMFCEAYNVRVLNNNPFYPCDFAWLEEIDNTLTEMGITPDFRLSKLAFGSLPIAIPYPEDFPAYGHIRRPALKQAYQQLQAVNYRGDSFELDEAIACLTRWLELTDFDPTGEQGLVGFYH